VNSLDQSLNARIDELLESHRTQRLLSTTGPQAAVRELAIRTQGLEKALRELAAEVERLSASK
jgi:hypothetical protein